MIKQLTFYCICIYDLYVLGTNFELPINNPHTVIQNNNNIKYIPTIWTAGDEE